MDSATLFKNINELIVALSSLLWPIVILFIVLLFKKDISSLLKRLKKGKLFGQEVELDANVDDFQKTVKEAERELPDLPKQPEEYTKLDADINEVLKASEINPEIGILRLSSLLEKDIRVIAASLGDLDSNNKTSAIRQFEVLLKRKRLPQHTNESLRIFWNLRNQIVHGHGKHKRHDILRILDIGLDLLKMIRSIPHETNIIYHPGVEIFEDELCTISRKGVKGLILSTTSSDGSRTFKRIFPTTHDTYYQRGKKVSWEWNLSNVWDKTWYVDPNTKKKVVAWDSAGEFVGRHVDEI